MSITEVLNDMCGEEYRAVTIPTLLVFNAVYDAHPGDLAQSELGGVKGLENLSPTCLAKQCRLLRSLGLIYRHKNPYDQRQYLLEISTKGLDLWEQLK